MEALFGEDWKTAIEEQSPVELHQPGEHTYYQFGTINRYYNLRGVFMFEKNENNLIGTILQVMLGTGLVVSTSVLIHANSSEMSVIDELLLLEQRCIEVDSIEQRISLNPSCMLELD
ncbi:MAG: hypothetical protein OXO49_07285 [Gammaproteobacteria bacterium]|nr:hypothetical protein [Gammaproteobacteria bacterium]MDE0252466.1 hypothetical protein [Gammaproteobacteria bacterium]MDE0402425.1 hypothetical protein [Gammaproteobacteria bacterium]